MSDEFTNSLMPTARQLKKMFNNASKRNLWLTLAAICFLAASFIVYVRAEKTIGLANDRRHASILLADELRQSSDDLTRMVRTYVVTGSPLFRQHYQEILDIRDGKRPRPVNYENVYWDLVRGDAPRPRPFGQAIPLIELMRQAGFTQQEFEKLQQAKARSDALTQIEFAAMRIIESSSGLDERFKAIAMLHDAAYHEAKADIMQPIGEFNDMVNQRTWVEVKESEAHAFRFRLLVIFSALLTTLSIWRLFRTIETDITELNTSRRKLIKAKAAAESANAAKSEFLSRMSHELRTPLNAIIGFAQVLALPGKPTLSEQQADNVQEILKAGQHLLTQVNEVLDLARIESGHIELSLEPLSLGPLVADCIAQVLPLAEARRITIVAPRSETRGVHADATRAKQVMFNLLSNAIKFNREGGQIHVSSIVTGERIRVEVRDTGRGIAPENRSRLFKPFERLESSYDGIEGSGIGLALAKRLIEAMNGEIGMESEVGVGSTFWFTLPAAQLPNLPVRPHASIDADDSSTEMASHQTPIQNPRHVLYIEDNPANLKLVKKIIGQHADVVMSQAEDAERGLEIARRERPDLILLDINLPGMDGFAALAALKSDPTTRRIPVIAITANAMKGDIERGKAAGFKDYLTKPIDIVQLHQILDALSAGESL